MEQQYEQYVLDVLEQMNNEQEQWDVCDIKRATTPSGKDSYFIASTLGRIARIRRHKDFKDNPLKLLSGSFDKDGYKRFKIHGKLVYGHRVIAKTFIPNDAPEREQVNHINGVRDDNRASNLEWVTCSENVQHSFDTLGKKANITTAKKVDRFDKDTGEYINTYPTMKEASLDNGGSGASAISNGIKFNEGYALGYIWKLSEDM